MSGECERHLHIPGMPVASDVIQRLAAKPAPHSRAQAPAHGKDVTEGVELLVPGGQQKCRAGGWGAGSVSGHPE